MPCAAPARGKNDLKLPLRPGWQHDPCGLPAVTFIGLTDVTAENRCLLHQTMKRGQAAIGRWIVFEGGASGWGTPDISGNLIFTSTISNVVQSAGYAGITPNDGDRVLLRINAVVLGEYLVTQPFLMQPGQIAFDQGKTVYFADVNRNGVDNTATLSPLNGQAVTLDWHVI